jgi:hypothetical protein
MMILDKRITFYTDMLCSDMVLAGLNYGWYSRMVDYQATVDFTNSNYKPWRYYYRIVLSSNQFGLRFLYLKQMKLSI